MTFTVLWTSEAEGELAKVWINSLDRKSVTAAAHEIDALLRVDPQTRGESRTGTRRILFVAPLGADFDVIEKDRTVYVVSVWRTRPE